MEIESRKDIEDIRPYSVCANKAIEIFEIAQRIGFTSAEFFPEINDDNCTLSFQNNDRFLDIDVKIDLKFSLTFELTFEKGIGHPYFEMNLGSFVNEGDIAKYLVKLYNNQL